MNTELKDMIGYKNLFFPVLSLRTGVLVGILLLFIQVSAQPDKPRKKNKKNTKNQPVQIDPAIKSQIDLIYVDATTEMLIGNYKKALTDFSEVMRLNPNHHAAMYSISKIYYETSNNADDLNQAITYAQKAIKLDPSNYWYYHICVEIHKKQSDFANGIKVQKQITEKFPKEQNVFNHLAELYAKNKEYDNALGVIQKLESEHDYYDEDLGVQKYKLCIEAGKLDLALSTVERLIQNNPTKPEYHYAKYSTLTKYNRPEDAVNTLKSLLEQSPDDGYALLTLADYYKNKNRPEESDKYLFRAFSNPDISIEGKINVVQNLQSKQSTDPTAKQRLTRLTEILVATHPHHPSVLRLKGDLYSFRNQPDSAHYFYRQSVEVEGAQLEVWNKMLEVAFALHDYEILKNDVNNALEYFPNNDNFYYYLGMANLGLKDYEQAEYAFEKVKRRGASAPLLTARVYAGTGIIAGINNKKNEAENDFRKAITLAPDDPLIMSQYSLFLSIYGESGDLSNATRMAEKSVQVAPEIPETHYALATACFVLGLYDKAEASILKALKICETADYLERYGDILLKLGKQKEAIIQWEKAISKGNKQLKVAEKLNP